MPIITVPEFVQLLPLREAEPVPPWTWQPDGNELYVGDLMEASDVEQKVFMPVHVQMQTFRSGAPKLERKFLRPYQEECADAVFSAWQSGRTAPIIVMGTGAGKTIVAGEIVRRLREANPGANHRVWFLAPREELLDQAYKAFKLVAPEATCGIVQGSRNDVGKYVTIGSVDTLAGEARFRDAISGRNRMVHSMVARPPDVVIVDECHHATSPTSQRLLGWIRAANPNCLLLGMTATPGRTDGTGLDSVFNFVAYERNIFQLLADGYLVPPTGFRIDLKISLDVVPTEDGDFKKAPLSKVMNQLAVNEEVVEGYIKHGDHRKMLAFCVDVVHAKDLAEQFRVRGIAAQHVDGKMNKGTRVAALQGFAEGKIRILTSCNVLTEGYDDPSAQGVILARPTSSQLVYIQMVGRALRLHPSKRDALVIDCVGNSSKYKLAQLASLAGLEAMGGGMKPGERQEQPELEEALLGNSITTRIDFRILRERASRWSWRETRFGWTVSIPRVGYFLLAWASNDRQIVDVKFHDMRKDKRGTLPKVLTAGVDFDMAYGLVEQEIKRIFAAGAARDRANGKSGNATDETRDIIDDSMAEELFSPEVLMRKDAEWRERPTGAKLRSMLEDIGVKAEAIPEKAGEASDLFEIMTIERNAKMREPATQKQKGLIMRQRLASTEDIEKMTKKEAQGLIVAFIKKQEAKKAANERFASEEDPELLLDEAPRD